MLRRIQLPRRQCNILSTMCHTLSPNQHSVRRFSNGTGLRKRVVTTTHRHRSRSCHNQQILMTTARRHPQIDLVWLRGLPKPRTVIQEMLSESKSHVPVRWNMAMPPNERTVFRVRTSSITSAALGITGRPRQESPRKCQTIMGRRLIFQ